MHIAYVCADPGVPVFGRKGCSVHVQEVLRALRRRGDRITLLCASQGGEPPDDLADLTIRSLPRLPGQQDESFPTAVETLAWCSEQALNDLSVSGIDLIYERHSLWSHRAMEEGARLTIPTCLEVNAPLILEEQRYRSLLHPELAHRCVNRAYQAAGTIIAVSNQVAGSIQQQCPRGSVVHVVHNGVNVDRFQETPARENGSGMTIGFCGSLRPWHGVIDLVEAFARHIQRHPGSRLTIIGDGPMRKAIEQRVRSLALEQHVMMTGAVSPAEIPGWLSGLDVGVVPYPDLPDLYFSPLKLFEYLAAGLCVVASRVGDIDTLIEQEHTGILYSPGDLDGLSAALDRLCLQPELRRSIGARGQILARSRYSWDQAVEQILDHVLGSAEEIT